MAKYPEWSDINWNFPLRIRLITKTLKSEFGDMGREKRRRKRLYPTRDITVMYDRLTLISKITTLWKFYKDRYGAYEAFSFFISGPTSALAQQGLLDFDSEYVGQGDGVTASWDLPGKNTTSHAIYQGGVERSSGEWWTSVGDGADGADKVHFSVAPGDGEVVTADFYGNLRIRCRFMEDEMEWEDFYNVVGRTGVELKGLLNDE